MHTLHNHSLDKDVVFLHPGDYYATDQKTLLSTVLGSCVSVVLWDPAKRIGGMNHFMLPGNPKQVFYLDESGRYGMQAMELLINALMKLGLHKRNLVAKVFGGATVLATERDEELSISRANINFAFKYLELEQIAVEASDTGGKQARKIIFNPETGKVQLKRLGHIRDREVKQEESEYQRKLRERREANGFIDFRTDKKEEKQ
jgi:chemotaxis protein CheD